MALLPDATEADNAGTQPCSGGLTETMIANLEVAFRALSHSGGRDLLFHQKLSPLAE